MAKLSRPKKSDDVDNKIQENGIDEQKMLELAYSAYVDIICLKIINYNNYKLKKEIIN